MTDEARGTTVETVRAGGRGRPAFLATGRPSLSFQVTAASGWQQRAAEVEVLRDGRAQAFRIEGPQSQALAWPAEPLPAHSTAEVRIRVQGYDGGWSPFGAPLALRTGPLVDDFSAPFIALPGDPGDERGTVRFRREVEVADGLRSATLSTTAHGVAEPVVNGEIVGDEVLSPGWTAYEARLLFHSHDVTALLRPGRNVLGATVAEGWYRERFGFDGAFRIAYPGPVALAAQLRLEYADGRIETVVTDDSWTATDVGPTVAASIYQGETFDARLIDAALADVDVSLPAARAAVLLEPDGVRLEPAAAPPIRRIERVPVAEVLPSASGGSLLDFGQNLVGWLELRVDLPAGTELVLRHAEVLEHGELGTRPLRFAAATDRFVSDGTPRTWSPRFTFHGFRYAEITGARLDPGAVTAIVVHSDLTRTGTLVTSHPQLNRLHENVVWGMRGNFVGIPSDCPQRDERLGWTGDIQVFAPTASYLYDVDGFLRSWLRDLALEQPATGGVPFVIPSPLPEDPEVAAAWGDAATLVPDTLFARYGDPGVLADQYESMRRFVEAERALAGDDLLWTGSFQFGDWLDPSAPPDRPADAKTDGDLVASAYFHHSTARLAAAARVLGKQEDAVEYEALAAGIRAAFVREYVTEAGRLLSDAHTAYAIAIAFGLVEGEQRQRAGDRLAELVRAYGYRVRTGFVGTPLICDALTATGHVDTAYRLVTETGNPSWLYPITMGATTIWERWDSMLPDGSINPGEMTSFNHYALGAVADWLQRTTGGIAPIEPGYRVAAIRPVPGGGITSAEAALETGYGRIATSWRIEDGVFRLQLTVPVGVTALVTLPGSADAVTVQHGPHEWTVPFATAAVETPSFTMDSSLADLVDDFGARDAIEGFFAEIGYFIGLGWTGSGRWRADTPLRSSLMMFPPDQRGRLDELLDDLNRR